MASTSAEGVGIKKRAAPVLCYSQSKRLMVDRPSQEERIPNLAFIPPNESKFVSAVDVLANARRDVQMMPEISDEELLQMAIEFEKKHPQ